MSNQRIKIPRSPDRTIINLFKTLNECHDAQPFNIITLGSVTTTGIDHLNAKNNEVLQLITEQNSYLIDQCSTSIKCLSISYHRGGNYTPDKKSPIFDEITINETSGQPKPPPKAIIEIITTINKQLIPFESDITIPNSKLEAEKQLLAIHQATLEKLEHLNEDLIRKSSEFRTNLEKKYEEKSEALNNETAKKERLLETEYSQKESALAEKEEKLNQRLSEIDDRDNTHARRQIRDKMLSDVKERISAFGLSETTEKKRLPVLSGIIALTLALATLLYLTTVEIHSANEQNSSHLELARNALSQKNNDTIKETTASISTTDLSKIDIYWLWARFSILSFGLAGTILYYIKWQNKWAEQHANTELQLQQFYIDVNRANWVIESCLEWRKETDSPIPKELISSITSNLFKSQQTESEQVIHPADELASALMGSASKLRLKLGDHEMEFDKPNKISKKAIPSKSDQEEKA